MNSTFKTSTSGKMSGLCLGPILAFLNNGDLETLDQFLDCEKVDIDEDDDDGCTGLHHAVIQNKTQFVSCLLNKGANPNKSDVNSRTPLNEAVIEDNAEVVQALLEAGADTELSDTENWTPLLSACYLGHLDCVRILLKAGASVYSQDRYHLLSYQFIITGNTQLFK